MRDEDASLIQDDFSRTASHFGEIVDTLIHPGHGTPKLLQSAYSQRRASPGHGYGVESSVSVPVIGHVKSVVAKTPPSPP